MHLESLITQIVFIPALDMQVRLSRAETIHTENSYKFTDEQIGGLLAVQDFAWAALEGPARMVWRVSSPSGLNSCGLRLRPGRDHEILRVHRSGVAGAVLLIRMHVSCGSGADR